MSKFFANFSLIFASIMISFLVISPTSGQVLVAQTEPGVVGNLSQLLGVQQETIDSELALGKTLLQIAEEYGMPEKTFVAKVKTSTVTNTKSTSTIKKATTTKKTPVVKKSSIKTKKK